MTVTDLDNGKIKIALTDKEVLTCFGSYGRLYAMSDNTKIVFESILEGILRSRGFSLKSELLIQVKAKENNGCVIIISPAENRPRRTKNEYLFIFENSESLASGIAFLYKSKPTRNLQSDLYKCESDYRLILYSPDFKPAFLVLKEYCKQKAIKPFETDYTKEHGKLLIEKYAVKTFGAAFFKEI